MILNMATVLARIATVFQGGDSMPSIVVLKPLDENESDKILPIRIGKVEAASISSGVKMNTGKRPTPHDLMIKVIDELGAEIDSVLIHRVEGTIFYALLRLKTSAGKIVSVDARPSDALAIAVRLHRPIYVDSKVLETCKLPDFAGVERELQEILGDKFAKEEEEKPRPMTKEEQEEFNRFCQFLDDYGKPEDNTR
jgi:bifunctional DNase/RNase